MVDGESATIVLLDMWDNKVQHLFIYTSQMPKEKYIWMRASIKSSYLLGKKTYFSIIQHQEKYRINIFPVANQARLAAL